ncbi:ribonuclease HI family protein [Candidatus Berkelbacteria bacterium]|nr:ribonuclease HI family protein [Candidatus Berkelbacteria bacterium]
MKSEKLRENESRFFVYTDGGSRGNPGKAAVGVVVKNEAGKNLAEFSRYLGENFTNNQAEYLAVLEALRYFEKQKLKAPEIKFFLDSELVVNQLNQSYKVKNSELKPLYLEVLSMVSKLGGRVSFQTLPRKKNFEADKLLNQTLDNYE